ncbi:hypothetical protein D3C73_785470 [compost metagenome]
MDGCPKAEGMMMMIRSLSPEVLIVDEIGRPEDAIAIHEALHAGITVIATAHGVDLADVKRRPTLRELVNEGVFTRYVILQRRYAQETQIRVYDASGQALNVPTSYRIGRG